MKNLAKSRRSKVLGITLVTMLFAAAVMPLAGAAKGGVGGKDTAPGQIRKTTTKIGRAHV